MLLKHLNIIILSILKIYHLFFLQYPKNSKDNVSKTFNSKQRIILKASSFNSQTLIKEMRDLKLEPPIFEEKRGDFWVIFKNHNLMTKEDIQWIKNLNIELTEDEVIALTFIKKNGKITNGLSKTK